MRGGDEIGVIGAASRQEGETEMNVPTVEELESRLGECLKADDYDGAVLACHQLGQLRPLTADELVQQSRSIQLSSEESTLELEDVPQVLESALAIARAYLPALLELGWFHFAMMDDAKKAREYFHRARELALEYQAEAQDGLQQCDEELADCDEEEGSEQT